MSSSSSLSGRRALLVGSSFSAAPMFERLKRRGLTVAVCGSLRSDPCHQYADASHFIDYSDREALLDLVRTEGFDFVVPTCNDYSYMAAAWVAQQTGHPGFDRFEVAEILHTKDRFRSACTELGIPVPRALKADGAGVPAVPAAWFPLLIKPVDSFSGRGVTRVTAPEGVAGAVVEACRASRTGTAVVEEFVEGTLHSHSAFIADGRIVLDFFVDEFCTVYPYQVNCSNHPSLLRDGVRSGVREAMQSLVSGLGLANGLLHTQFIAHGEAFHIIEPMRRCPGDLYGNLIERSTGIDYTDRFVAGFLGEAARPVPAAPAPRPYGRHTISVQQEQVAHAFSYAWPGRSSAIVPLKNSGETLKPAPYDKLAILFNEYDSIAQMAATTACMKDHVAIESLSPRQDLL